MVDIYKPVKIIEIGVGGGGGTPVFQDTFQILDWTLNGTQYEYTVLQSVHQLGSQVIVQVEELDGIIYREVEVTVENSSGDITLIIGDDLRFIGRVLLKGQ